MGRRQLRSADGKVEFVLPDRDATIRIGRAPDNDLVLDDTTVSRHHCSLKVRSDAVIVTDSRSTAGTFVAESKIAGGVELRPGGSLRLGRTTLALWDLDATGDRADDGDAGGWQSATGWMAPVATSSDRVAESPVVVRPTNGPAPGRPAQPVAAGTWRERAGKGRVAVRGHVRDQQLRTETIPPSMASSTPPVTMQVLTFSLDSFDEHGDRLSTVAVSIRAPTLRGQLPANGRQVIATGRFSRDDILMCDSVRDVETGATLRAPNAATSSPIWYKVLVALVVMVVLGILAAVGYSVVFDKDLRELNPTLSDVTVPTFSPGDQSSVVQSRIRDSGLWVEVFYDSSTEVPFGRVIRISPGPGTTVREGSTVKVYVNVNQTR